MGKFVSNQDGFNNSIEEHDGISFKKGGKKGAEKGVDEEMDLFGNNEWKTVGVEGYGDKKGGLESRNKSVGENLKAGILGILGFRK